MKKSAVTIDSYQGLAIIPAAGYGRRVGSPQSKELLPHPQTKEPLIQNSFNTAQTLNLKPHLITREEKHDLIKFANNQDIDVQICKPTPEWPATVLESQPKWKSKNLLLLPDSECGPQDILKKMIDDLDDFDLTIGYFNPDDLQTYGVFEERKQKKIWHCEKPKEWSEVAIAWGVIGFRPKAGQILFQQMLQSTFDHGWRPLPFKIKFYRLDFFRDLTRGDITYEKYSH